MIKLFLDDERNPPDDTWNVVRTVFDAKAFLLNNRVDVISFDHDLGESNKETGYDLATWLEVKAWCGEHVPEHLHVHSQNPVGVARIEQVIRSIKKLVSERAKQCT